MTTSTSNNEVLPSQALNEFVPPAMDLETRSESQSAVRYGIEFAEIHLLIPQFGGSEVLLQSPTFQLPNTPGFLLGVSNIRGNIVPIYDLFKAFNLRRARPEAEQAEFVERRKQERQQRILVLGVGDRSVGLVIANLPEVVPVFDDSDRISELQPLPDRLAKFVLGGYVINGTHWHEVDFMQLIKDLSGNE